MPNKQAILENVDMYSADELVQFIKVGIVTFEELCDETDGYFSASVRKEVEKKLAGSEEDDWQIAKSSNSLELLENYLSAYPNGNYAEEAYILITKLKKGEKQDNIESVWDRVNKNSIEELTTFCNRYPNAPHSQEAQRLINELWIINIDVSNIDTLKAQIKSIETTKEINKNEKIYNIVVGYLKNKKIAKSDLLKLIENDSNVFCSQILSSFISDGYLTYPELSACHIDQKFILNLAKAKRPQDFDLPFGKLQRIEKVSTEVYFWGIPSSGKSCALGAILSVADNGTIAKSMIKDNNCFGYGYMNRLSSLFKTGEACVLPGKTPLTATYEMGFDLVDEDGKVHPLTCMDLAGELMRCMYKYDAKEELTEVDLETLDVLTNALIDPKTRTKNKKIHFFVMEYGAEDREYDGLIQNVYLNGALRYIERTGIFENDTIAIYVIITKVDKAHAKQGQLASVLEKYVNENYKGFYNGLTKICKDFEINNGKVEIIPFSLGKVCFQDYCLFDAKPAENIVRKLLERTKGFANNRLHHVLNILKK